MSALWVSFFKQDDYQKILDFNTIINSIILLINTFYLHGNFFGLISQPTDEMDNIFDKVIYVLKLNSNKQEKSMKRVITFILPLLNILRIYIHANPGLYSFLKHLDYFQRLESHKVYSPHRKIMTTSSLLDLLIPLLKKKLHVCDLNVFVRRVTIWGTGWCPK